MVWTEIENNALPGAEAHRVELKAMIIRHNSVYIFGAIVASTGSGALYLPVAEVYPQLQQIIID
jgi:hypothetical protein